MTHQKFLLITVFLLTVAIANRVLTEPIKLVLDKPSSSYRISTQYDCKNAKLEFTINYTTPGVIFDTIGIDAAPIGSWTISISEKGIIAFSIYDPLRASKGKIANGWHHLYSSKAIPKGSTHKVTCSILNGKLFVKIDDGEANFLALDTALSGKPLYVGDYPGDDHWGSNYRIHPAMIGTVTILSWGAASGKTVMLPSENQSAKTAAKPAQPKPAANPTAKAEDPKPAAKPAANQKSASSMKAPSPPSKGSEPTHKPIINDSAAVVNECVQKIQDALQRKDAEKAIKLTTRNPELAKIFRTHKEELPRLAKVLSTKKLVAIVGSYAEYEVIENGRTFPVVLYKVNGEWLLDSI